MSLKYRDKNGAEAVICGLTPGGDLAFGASTTRSGTTESMTINSGSGTAKQVTFSDAMPDDDYEVVFSIAPNYSYVILTTGNKTASGFNFMVTNEYNQALTFTVSWKAFKLYDVADAEQLYSTVQDLEAMVPSNASSTNKFATINDLTGETRPLDRRIDDLEDYMPSTVSISNKVATQADLANVSIDELGDIEDVDLDDVADGQTLVWDSANSKWVNGAGGKTYTAGDGITISNTDEISAKVDDTSITTDTNDALKVADTYKTIFVGTRAQWDALSTADKVKYNEAHITDDVIGGEVADEVTDGDMRPVTSNAVYDHTLDVYSTSETKTNKVWIDDKPIYRKVLHYTGVATAGTSTLVGSITGFADVISIEGTFRNNNDNNCFYIGYTYSNFGATVAQNMPFVMGNNGNVYANPYGFDIKNINVTVEYTKTT